MLARPVVRPVTEYVTSFAPPLVAALQQLIGQIGTDNGAIIVVGPGLCFKDALRLEPAGVGDLCYSVTDQSGQGFHLTAMSDAARGTIVEDADGYWDIRSNGVDTGYHTDCGDGATGMTMAGFWRVPAFDTVLRTLMNNRGIDSAEGNPLRPAGIWVQGNANNNNFGVGVGDGTTFTTASISLANVPDASNFICATTGDGNRRLQVNDLVGTTVQVYAPASTPAPGTADNPEWIRIFDSGSPLVASADGDFGGGFFVDAFRDAAAVGAIRRALGQLRAQLGRSL